MKNELLIGFIGEAPEELMRIIKSYFFQEFAVNSDEELLEVVDILEKVANKYSKYLSFLKVTAATAAPLVEMGLLTDKSPLLALVASVCLVASHVTAAYVQFRRQSLLNTVNYMKTLVAEDPDMFSEYPFNMYFEVLESKKREKKLGSSVLTFLGLTFFAHTFPGDIDALQAFMAEILFSCTSIQIFDFLTNKIGYYCEEDFVKNANEAVIGAAMELKRTKEE